MRAAALVGAAAAAVAIAATACWVRDNDRSMTRMSDDANPEWTLSLLLLGAQDGEIEPCGCAQPQLGGVERLAALVDDFRKHSADPVVVQLGGATASRPGGLGATKDRLFEDCLRLLRTDTAFTDAIGSPVPGASGVWRRSVYSASGVARDDDAMGSAGWQFDVERTGIRLRVASWTTRPPLDEMAEWRMEMGAGATETDDRVRLDAADGATALAAARARILATGRGFLIDLGEHVTPGRDVEGRVDGLVELGLPARGRACGTLELRRESKGLAFRYRVVELGPDWNSAQSELTSKARRRIDEYRSEVERSNLVRRTTIAPERQDGSGFVGAAACHACHRTQAAHWDNSPHAHSLRTLADRRRSADPECLPCHTTGWTRSAAGSWMRSTTGFAGPRATAQLDSVECEACHGPGAQHVEAAGRGDPASARTAQVAIGSCTPCHNPDASPHFLEEFKRYWSLVCH